MVLLVKLPGCNPINYQVGGPVVGYLNQACFTYPTVSASAAGGSFPAVMAATTSRRRVQLALSQQLPAGQVFCENLMPLNVGRNSINGPNFSNLDFSIHKVFPIRRISEAFNIQFRAEIFDIFNHSNFNPPQPNSGDSNSGLLNPDGSYAAWGTSRRLRACKHRRGKFSSPSRSTGRTNLTGLAQMPVRFGGRAFVFYGEPNGWRSCLAPMTSSVGIVAEFAEALSSSSVAININHSFSGNFQGAGTIVHGVPSGLERVKQQDVFANPS